jgi:hypothetical protein
LWQQARTSADVAFKIGEDASVSEDDAIATITLMQTLGALVDDAERWEQRWVPTAAFTVAITNLATTVVTILAGLLPDPDGSG